MKELFDIPDLEPETIRQFYPFMTDLDAEQIQVIKVLRDTRAAYEDMDVFENAVSVLNGISPNVLEMEGSEPEYIWRALDIIFRLHPDIELAWEVLMYIKYIFNDNGCYFYHPKLPIENIFYDEIVKRAIYGPFPIEEDFIGIQAVKYLKIQEYLKMESGK
jgi:hypothetical protein